MPRLFCKLVVAIALGATAVADAAPGDLDTAGFGAGFGKVMTTIGTAGASANAVALQPDGKIVVAGTCMPSGNLSNFCIARYNSTGSLDPTFGNAGIVSTLVGGIDSFAKALALQMDGKIVVAGYCGGRGHTDVCLARYLPTGALDSSFNGSGTVISSLFSASGASAMALQPDGRIVVAGWCVITAASGTGHFCVARYSSSGQLDTSFGTTGTTYAPIGTGGSYAQSIALQPDGKIVVAGDCYSASGSAFCVARIGGDSALFDPSFNGTGTAVIQIVAGGSHDARAIGLQADGKLVVAGTCSTAVAVFCLARFLPGGSLDGTFNGTGSVSSAIANFNSGNALAIQTDGRILVAGSCKDPLTNYLYCVARYWPSGALDTTFGTSGWVTKSIGSVDDSSNAVTVQPDGKIVAAGACKTSSLGAYAICLARYQGGPFEARDCSLDIDGDNQVLTTTDSLIHARIALGMTGPAVVSGITFAANATRNTWPLIRNYLVTQCGMSLVQ